MAPVETHPEPSFLPLAALGLHVVLAAWLTGLVGRTLVRSFLALPPSQATRGRAGRRRGHLRVFAGLVGVSLCCALYWRWRFAVLSYEVWADERGVVLPDSFFGDRGALRGGEHPGRLHLARWLSDTPIYRDALEIVSEKARRVWWGEQLDLATTAWGMLLGIEGRRRKIPYLWAFMMLAHAVSLSFAQNLFYITMLLTPVPLPDNVKELTKSTITASSRIYSNFVDRIFPSRPDSWCPHPILYLIPLIASFTTVFLSPFAANTPSFVSVTLVCRSLTFAPLILPYIVPESWGTVHLHPHDVHSAYTALFRTISIVSALLHGKSTVLALLFNTPDSHNHRHSMLHPFKQEQRTVLERSSTAIGKVLGALGDHPAVSAIGWDVILSGMSTGIWAAIRGLDVHSILSSSGLLYSGASKVADTLSDTKSISSEIEETAEKSIERLNAAPTPAKRRPGRPRKPENLDGKEISTPSVPRRRGRPRKSSYADSDYQPTEAVHEEGDEDEDENLEPAALTWGLIAMTGLGTGSSGVFGAETTAR